MVTLINDDYNIRWYKPFMKQLFIVNMQLMFLMLCNSLFVHSELQSMINY